MNKSDAQGLKPEWMRRLPTASPDLSSHLTHSAVAGLRKMSDVLGPRSKDSTNLVLFSGPGGAGKTIATQVLAGRIGLNAYRIDTPQIVSKYIGETEKNLDAVFHSAGNDDAILFFDEADALFGKRTEVKDSHDRYANINVSSLLKRIKAFRGIVIVASNQNLPIDRGDALELSFAP